MEKKLKIVTIGGGSSYTPELCEGLINRYQDLPISEWVLVDTLEKKGQEKNEIIAALVKRMFAKAKLKVKVWTAYEVTKEVLDNATFVTTQLRVGFLEARRDDERIAFKHGMLGQETNGIGGQFKAMRTIPVLRSIVQKVKKYCNGAWIINFTNPASIITEAIHELEKYPYFVGLCNVPIGMQMGVAKILDYDYRDLKVDACGLNHMVFLTNFYKDNQNITNDVLQAVVDPKRQQAIGVKNIASIDWNPHFIKALKALPCPYHRYYFKRHAMFVHGMEDYEKNGTRAEQVMEVEKQLFIKYQDPNLNVKPPELSKRGGTYYSDVACGVMRAIYLDTHEEFVVNTVNNGKIANLPADWIVEVTCEITNRGPIKVAREITLPNAVKALVYSIKQFEKMIIQAVANNSYDQALLAAITHPLAEDDVLTEKAFKELMVAHAKYLPELK